MRTDRSRARRIVVVLGSIATLIAAFSVARGTAAQTESGPRAGSGPLPASIMGADRIRPPGGAHAAGHKAPVGMASLPPADRAAIAADSHHETRLPAIKPGVPVALDIAIPSPAHPNGVHARVTADPLNADGTLYVPADPQTVSWAKQDAKPGSTRGTVILTSHINYVIDGQLVIGALSDLAWYAEHAVGKQFRVRLADGRVLRYRIVVGREYTKDDLADNAALRRSLYDQSKVYGSADSPSSRLLLVSCGGAFDEYTGEYEDNVFLYALPVR